MILPEEYFGYCVSDQELKQALLINQHIIHIPILIGLIDVLYKCIANDFTREMN